MAITPFICHLGIIRLFARNNVGSHDQGVDGGRDVVSGVCSE